MMSMTDIYFKIFDWVPSSPTLCIKCPSVWHFDHISHKKIFIWDTCTVAMRQEKQQNKWQIPYLCDCTPQPAFSRVHSKIRHDVLQARTFLGGWCFCFVCEGHTGFYRPTYRCTPKSWRHYHYRGGEQSYQWPTERVLEIWEVNLKKHMRHFWFDKSV